MKDIQYFLAFLISPHLRQIRIMKLGPEEDIFDQVHAKSRLASLSVIFLIINLLCMN